MALTLPELSATAQVGLIAGVIGLFLLFTAGFVMTLVYRKRFLIFSKKCSALDADLGKTRRELLGTKNLLAEKSRSHRQMLDTAGAAIFELSEAGECIYANAALGALLGVPEGHLLGDGLIGFVHPDDRERVRQQWLNFDKRKPSLRMSFRFQIADGKDVYVTERGSLLINARKKVSGYFGQIMDVGEQMSECLEARRVERRTDRFIEQTTDGFYRLSLTEPVSVSLSPEQITDHIEQHAVLASCSANLAALYGRTAEQMTGRALKEIPGGFGVFEGKDQIRQFVENGFSVSGRDSDFTDHRGKPRCLNHQAVGIMQNNQLTAVWGTVRDSTLEKREAEDARCHEAFLRQILDSLPCDVSAKDPRCRYVYVNRKFEERTGTPREDWEGKTVFQLVPGAPREFNRLSIEAMKTGTTCRRTDLTETAGRKRWIETIEAPLVGAEGVIEGVVGFSMDMTEIKKNEAQLRSECDALRRSLKESEDAVSAASAARLESVQQRDALSAEMKKTQEMLESREAQFKKTQAEQEKREEELTGVVQKLEARKAKEKEALDDCRKELDESRQQCSELASRMETLDAEFVARRKEFEQARVEHQAREEALNGTIQELESRKTKAEEELDFRSRQFKEETARRKELDAALRETRKTLSAEKEKIESESKAKIQKMEEALQTLTDSEKALLKERAQLTEELSEARQELDARTRELDTERSEWKTRAAQLTDLKQKLEETAAAQAARLETLTAERAELESGLKEARRKLAEGDKYVQLQVKQNTAAQRKELKKLQTDNKQLRTALGKSEARLKELDEAVRVHKQKLAEITAEKKEEQQSFRKTARELQTRLKQEQNRLAGLQKTVETERTEQQSAQKEWEKQRKALVAKTQELEERLRERTHELTFASATRREQEEKLSDSLREAEQIRDTVDQQIDEKTAELKNQLAEQSAQEEKLVAEQQALSDRLASLQEELAERTGEAEHLKKTCQALNEQVAAEKEELAQRIQLSKEAGAAFRRQEEEWAGRETELTDTIRTIEKQLAQKENERAQADKDRTCLKREIEQVRANAADGLRRMLELADDLYEPLQPVLELSEAALQEDGRPRAEQARLNDIYQSAKRLETVLSYRRELIRMEDGRLLADPQWFDLKSFINDLTGKFTAQAEADRLFFAFSRKGTLSGKCRADHEKAGQVLSALFDRAVVRTGKGQIGLHAVNASPGESRSTLSFMLMYSGLSDDRDLLEALSDSSRPQQDAAPLSAEEMELDLLCRQARLLGGTLAVENPAGRKPLLRFDLPIEQQPVSEEAELVASD